MPNMTEIEIETLELLLSKLRGHLGKRYCVIPGVVHGGFHLATYDEKGEVEKKVIGPTLKSVIKELNG